MNIKVVSNSKNLGISRAINKLMVDHINNLKKKEQ